jgi:hypothetical protein
MTDGRVASIQAVCSSIQTSSLMVPAHTTPTIRTRSIPRATSAPSILAKVTTRRPYPRCLASCLACETALPPCSHRARRLQRRQSKCPRASSARCTRLHRSLAYRRIARAPPLSSPAVQVAHKLRCRAQSSTPSTHHHESAMRAQPPCSQVLLPRPKITRTRSRLTCRG